ncbi:MAG: hypothetical protein DMG01_20490, partial [Acidobacteria bacterium]
MRRRRGRRIAPGSRGRCGTASISLCLPAAQTMSWPIRCAEARCAVRGYKACDETSTPRSETPAMPKRPRPDAAERIPDRPTLSTVREAARDCQACDLYKRGTQTVFGEGGRKAELMLVGEQPGDAEDLAGHPFVGPAGKLLDRALEDAGIDRAAVYVTNVVK